jgi:hypothetical protein
MIPRIETVPIIIRMIPRIETVPIIIRMIPRIETVPIIIWMIPRVKSIPVVISVPIIPRIPSPRSPIGYTPSIIIRRIE